MSSENDTSNILEKYELTQKGVDLVKEIRSNQPVRRVRTNGKNNVTRFASNKMKLTIQVESDLELVFTYTLEVDDDCIEYYDQPCKLKFKCGNRFINYTPDFFVMYKNEPCFVEVKPETELKKLVGKYPDRYTFNESEGVYKSEPLERYLASYGIGFEFFTNTSCSRAYIDNLYHLIPYLKKSEDGSVYVEAYEKVKSLLQKKNIISFSDIFDEYKSISIDDIYNLIVRKMIYVDLDEFRLTDRDTPFITLSRDAYQKAKEFMQRESDLGIWSGTVTVNDFIRFIGADKSYRIVMLNNNSCIGYSKDGDCQEFKLSEIPEMISKGIIVVQHETEQVYGLDYIRDINQDDMDNALMYKECLDKIDSGISTKIEASKEYGICVRTIRRKKIEYDKFKSLYGNGVLGLIPKTRAYARVFSFSIRSLFSTKI